MPEKNKWAHPLGEENALSVEAVNDQLATETFGGKIHVEWDPTAAVTPIGPLWVVVDTQFTPPAGGDYWRLAT